MIDALVAQREEGSGTSAAPRPGPLKHPNAPNLNALWLGAGCEGLTAIFAGVNGIRLALADQHRFTRLEVHQLIAAGLRFFDGRLSPQQYVLGGIRVQQWQGVIQSLAEATHKMSGFRVLPERLSLRSRPDRKAVFDALDEAVARLRVPLMLLRGGSYTAVSGTTPASILLFDSRGFYSIRKSSCGVPGDRSDLRHMIYPPALLALNV